MSIGNLLYSNVYIFLTLKERSSNVCFGETAPLRIGLEVVLYCTEKNLTVKNT